MRLLEVLDLSHNDLGPESGADLGAMLEATPSLKELKLRGCGLRDDGVQGLARGLGAQLGLRVLDLGENSCGDKCGG